MDIGLAHLLPKITSSGMRDVGFLFGCGTSKDAGYPLTAELTGEIVGGLAPSQRSLVDTLLTQEGQEYDDRTGLPDVESICDLLQRRIQATQDQKYIAVEEKIREDILQIMLDRGKAHSLEQHVRFLKALKTRTGNTAGTIWIFTTNYDLLFELAASEAGIPIVTGFDGAVERFFDPGKFDYVEMATHGGRAVPRDQLKFNLVKLHGSVSWMKRNERVIESALGAQPSATRRSMILPRKTKVVETLEHPYDNLFAYSRRVIGNQCRNIVSCGFGFRDQHINDNILTPALSNGRLRLVALYGGAANDLNFLQQHGGLQVITPNERRLDGVIEPEGSDLWMFEKLVQLIEHG